MARSKRVGLSGQHLELSEIDRYHRDVEASVNDYFTPTNPRSTERLLGYTDEEILSERASLLDEHGRSTSMTVLASLEAAFRVDFLQRCYGRERDAVSTAFRELYKTREQGRGVSLDDDILSVWRQQSSIPSRIISELRSAFKYRHWLAHGRYWEPKFPKYDYEEIYTLAETVFDAFPFREA